jgi:hypothetical protein
MVSLNKVRKPLNLDRRKAQLEVPSQIVLGYLPLRSTILVERVDCQIMKEADMKLAQFRLRWIWRNHSCSPSPEKNRLNFKRLLHLNHNTCKVPLHPQKIAMSG